MNKSTSPKILPSITTDDRTLFHNQLVSYLKFSKNIHIDFADGSITPNKLLSLDDVNWPADAKIWLHIMVGDPFLYLQQIVKLKPFRVIFPFDISFDGPLLATKLRQAGIESGIYLTNQADFDDAQWQLAHFQEVMIFGGHLGYQGAGANLDLLPLGAAIKLKAPFIELGWDGGVNPDNAAQIAGAGFNNIVSGDAIASSHNPAETYLNLKRLVLQ